MSGTTLFVVDMQYGFSAYSNCFKDVIREIKLAKRRRDPIVFVELNPDCNGPTDTRLIKVAEYGGYKKIAVTTKIGGDGSKELVEAAVEAGFQIKRVRVCGVNRYACVANTLWGLIYNHDKVRKVEVGFAATAPGPKEYKEDSLDVYSDYKRYIKDGLIIKR